MWFESRGVHPYLLVDEGEMEALKKHFAGTRSLAMLDTPPLMTYEGLGRIFLFDLAQSRNPAVTTLKVVDTLKIGCVRQSRRRHRRCRGDRGNL